MAEEQTQKIDLKFVTIIADRDRAEKILNSLEKLDANVIHVFYGNGTAPNELLSVLGLIPEKVVIVFTARQQSLKSIYDCLISEHKFNERGKGIAFTVPVVAVSGLASLRFLAGENLKERVQ